MTAVILGGGLAGLSLAHFLKQDSVILEKEERAGGLCRSFQLNGVCYDVGPHILFSKNREALDSILSLLETNVLKRSNRIFHDGRFVKYPFENGLSYLGEKERDYCLKEFLNNPYENFAAENMLQFFLKTFGEGMTRLYLQPYNEKIWKFDPAYMDTQMVERIPKPPKQDIIDSAAGKETEGYTHQLARTFASRLGKKAKIITSVGIRGIHNAGGEWIVETDKGEYKGDTLINCMPLPELFRYIDAPKDVIDAVSSLRYNSIHVVAVQAKKDAIGDNFALYVADKSVLFHRLSKLDFLGAEYRAKNASTILAEITYRPGSYLSTRAKEEITERVVSDLDRCGLVKRTDVCAVEMRSFQYSYVIYDLDHRRNTDRILAYLSGLGIHCCGRFAEFEYLNMDGIVEHSRRLAKKLNG